MIIEVIPFAITNLYKINTKKPIKLLQNEANKVSTIATLTVPYGYGIRFDIDDPDQDILFIPNNNNLDFVPGNLEVLYVNATGCEMGRLFHKNYDKSNYFLRHKWFHQCKLVSGDIIKFNFMANKLIDVEKSVLDARVKLNIIRKIRWGEVNEKRWRIS